MIAVTSQDVVTVLVAILVAIPATIAAIAAVRARRDIKTTNSGTTGELIEDSAKTVEVIQAQQHTTVGEFDQIHGRLGRIEGKLDRINGRVDRVERQLDKHLTEVGEDSGKLAAWIRKKMTKEEE